MKNLLHLTAIAVCVSFTSATWAQDKSVTPPANQATAILHPLDINMLTEQLQLTQEQVERLKSIDAGTKAHADLLDKTDPAKYNAQQKDLIAIREKEMNTVLTPEQARKMGQMKRNSEHARLAGTKSPPIPARPVGGSVK